MQENGKQNSIRSLHDVIKECRTKLPLRGTFGEEIADLLRNAGYNEVDRYWVYAMFRGQRKVDLTIVKIVKEYTEQYQESLSMI